MASRTAIPSRTEVLERGIAPEELDKLLVAVEKKMGDDGAIHRGNMTEYVRRIPFISPNLNYASEGGIAIGRANAFWGGESAFKTRALYELIAQAQNLYESSERALMPRIRFYKDRGDDAMVQKLTEELEFIQGTWPDGMECAFYNAEQQYDKVWAAKLGIDTDRLVIVQSQTIEDIVSVMEASFHAIDFHAIDSTSSASSVEEQGMKMTDRRMGLDARVWKQTLRKSMRHFDHQRNVIVLVHQVSTNIRTGGEQAVTTRHMRHTSSMTLRFQRGRFLYMKDGFLREDAPPGADEQSLAGRKEADGVEVFVTTEKSRVCRPFRIAALHARHGAKHFDHLWELGNAAEYLGIAVKSGSFYKVADDEKSVQGEKGLRERVEDDPALQDRIYAELMHRTVDEDE